MEERAGIRMAAILRGYDAARMGSWRRRGTWALATSIAVGAPFGTGACARPAPAPVPPPPPQLPGVAKKPASTAPEDSFWQPVDPDTKGTSPRPVELPIAGDAIVRAGNASRLWDELGEPGRQRLRASGVVVTAPAPGEAQRWQLGASYMEWRDAGLPYVVTLDALFAVTMRALARALADVEHHELAPLLDALLARLDVRLSAEAKGAAVELSGGYRLARGIVAVARAVADEAHAPSPELDTVVKDEKALIDAHAGPAESHASARNEPGCPEPAGTTNRA